MAYLLDTDWVISFLNGRPDAISIVRGLGDDRIVLSTITCGEIYEGIAAYPSGHLRIRQFQDFLSRVQINSPTLEVARRYSVLRADLRAKGLLIPDNDLWIAATAMEHRLILATRDLHFSRIPGLQLYLGA